MTMFVAPRSRHSVRTRWVHQQQGLHVANRRGEFAGYVARMPHGLYVAFDEKSREVGAYDTLHDAQSAVTAGAQTSPVGRRPRCPLSSQRSSVPRLLDELRETVSCRG
jgi:hypothetical protein